MSMSLKIIPEAKLLSVVATGEFSLKEAESSFLNVIDAATEHMCEKILVDGRELTGEPMKFERFFYGKFVAEMCVDFLYILFKRGHKAPKFAYVLKEPVLDPQRFGETVAMNRGMIVKAFDNINDALSWLD